MTAQCFSLRKRQALSGTMHVLMLRTVAVCCCCCCLFQSARAEQDAMPASPAVQADASPAAPDFDAAMKKSDIKTLASHFHATIELVMPEKKQASYAKAQAEQIIKSFLETNKPSDCVRTHNSQRDNERSTVSRLLTDKGAYRLTIQTRPIDGALRIFSLRIEEDND